MIKKMKFEKIEISDIKYNIKFLYDENFLSIKIREQKDINKKYKDIKFRRNNEGNIISKQFHKIITILKSFDKEKIKDMIKIYKKPNKNKLRIILNNNKNEENNVIEIETYLLNIKYYLTTGPDNKRINNEPSYSYLENKSFTLFDIENLIKKEKLDEIYEFDSYKMQNKNGFYEKIGYGNYEINSELILELHYKNTKNYQPIDMEKYTHNILDLKKRINNISNNSIDYDLIYLYSSPIIDSGEELDKPISYREEMEIIINIMKKKGKKFNCLFECIDYDVFRDVLMNKRTKVLHISSHGLLKKSEKKGKDVEYNLIVENLKKYGERQDINENLLESTIKYSAHNIKNMEAIILFTCYSEGLKEIFKKYNQNIIYIDKYKKIGDFTSVEFTKYFYEELFEGHSIQKCYENSKEKLKCDTKMSSYGLDIANNEILKIKFSGLENKNPDNNNKEKINGINLFKYNIKGEININKNVCVNFMASKYKSIIGRRKCAQKIFEYISKNENKFLCLVLYGQKGLRKRNFAESVCVYLIERKIIHKHDIYILESDMDYKNMENKIRKEKQNSNDEKSVKIIKFIYTHLNKKINDIKKDFKEYQNLYFLILYDLDDNQNDVNYKDKDFIYLNTNIQNPIYLFNYYYQLYSGLSIGDDSELKEVLKNIYTKPNQLEELSKKIIVGKLTLKEAINKLKQKDFEEVFKKQEIIIKIDEKNKDIYSLYYILSKFPSGLPDSLIRNVFGQIVSDPENLIKENQKNNWKFIDKNIIFEGENMIKYTKEYIIKFLNIYTSLIDNYISLNRKDINFKDNNIHIIFNSYNNGNIWKSNVEKIAGETRSFYENMDIFEHRKNISSLISLIIYNPDEYLVHKNIEFCIKEILLLFPSILFFKKKCNETIKTCIHFCNKCIEFKKDEHKVALDFERLKRKLLLYQFSIGETEKTINLDNLFSEKNNKDNNYSDLISEYKYIKCLKNLDIAQIYEENNNDIENKKKMALLYYEFSKKFFTENKTDESTKYINKAIINLLLYIQKDYYVQINEDDKINIFFKEFINKWYLNKIDKKEFTLEIKYLFRMIIDLCQVFKLSIINKKDEEIEEKIEYLNLILLDKSDLDLFNEAYYLKTELFNLKQPDIVMLNSNPIKNKYSILSSGIYSYLNNQYYILKKLKEIEKNEIESFIRIKSMVLNKYNLENTLSKNGEILIIQSDDFSEHGDIILEKDGESELLTKDEFIKICPSRISYKVIILCFKNSHKLVESIEKFQNINFDYIISFEYFDFFNCDNKTLIEYNKLCIEFIINFIKLSSKENKIRNIFNEAKNKFLKNDILNKISNKEFIYLTQKITDFGQRIEYSQEKREILLYESIPILNDNHECKNYHLDINDLLEQMKYNKYIEKYCCEKKKKRYIKIGFELIKYLFRHKIFSDYYDIDMKKISIDTLKSMIDENLKKKKKNFYFIYNCNKNSIKSILNNEDTEEKNDYYFIIYDIEHKNDDCDSEFDSDSDSEIKNQFDYIEENKKYSIFNYNFEKKYDESSNESIEAE